MLKANNKAAFRTQPGEMAAFLFCKKEALP